MFLASNLELVGIKADAPVDGDEPPGGKKAQKAQKQQKRQSGGGENRNWPPGTGPGHGKDLLENLRIVPIQVE